MFPVLNFNRHFFMLGVKFLTCNIPYLYSISRKLYSLACGALGVVWVLTPVFKDWLEMCSWWAKIFARLPYTGSETKAKVSAHSSIGCRTWSIFGCLNLSNCLTELRRISVTVSFLLGLCNFSAQRFSKRKTEHSWNK